MEKETLYPTGGSRQILTLITSQQLAKELSKRLNGRFTTGSVTRMRQARKIPYVKLGYRTLRYDLEKVIAALAKREAVNARDESRKTNGDAKIFS